MNKQIYTQVCELEKDIPIFSQAWWLDAVVGKDNWNVALVKNKNDEVIATMPYVLQKKFGFKISIMPKLTQTLGPWLKPFNGNYANKLGYEKDTMQALIEQLPKLHFFNQSWNYTYSNWLPFYWKGFNQTTRFTYVIEDLTDLDKVYANFQSKIKGDIKKANNRFNLVVRDDLSIEDFIALNKLVFSRQGIKFPYSDDLIREIDKACLDRNCRKLLIAVDKDGSQHAGAYIVWDKQTVYYLMGGSNPDLRNSGATSLCLWKAIEFSATVAKQFDFEGSMLEPVERFVRAFGAGQKPYNSISRSSSWISEFAMQMYKKFRIK